MAGGDPIQFIHDWSPTANIRAAFTTRLSGDSASPYAAFNLATHVGDDTTQVNLNRRLLRERLALPSEPFWLNQVHGVKVVTASRRPDAPPDADASYCATGGAVCVVLSADCLPILIASDDGQEIAAVHAGWRGLLDGVIATTVGRFRSAPRRLKTWLGPRISAPYYEVGSELIENFISADTRYRAACLRRDQQHFLDLGQIARLQLNRLGINEIRDCDLCTFKNSREFYSYRRDGVTGRFASLIWRTE